MWAGFACEDKAAPTVIPSTTAGVTAIVPATIMATATSRTAEEPIATVTASATAAVIVSTAGATASAFPFVIVVVDGLFPGDGSMSKQIDGWTVHISPHTVEIEVEIIIISSVPVGPTVATCRVEVVLHPELLTTSTSSCLCFMVARIPIAAECDIVAPTHRKSLSVESEGHPVDVVKSVIGPSVNSQGDVS